MRRGSGVVRVYSRSKHVGLVVVKQFYAAQCVLWRCGGEAHFKYALHRFFVGMPKPDGIEVEFGVMLDDGEACLTAPQCSIARYVSRAALIFARTQDAPPSRLHFSHSSSVIRTGRDFINSPVFANGLRPWQRPAPPRLDSEGMIHRAFGNLVKLVFARLRELFAGGGHDLVPTFHHFLHGFCGGHFVSPCLVYRDSIVYAQSNNVKLFLYLRKET